MVDFPGGSDGKASAYNAGDLGSIPGSGRSPGEGNGNHSTILAWKIPWTEDPGRLQSMGSQRVGHDWATSLSLSLWWLVWCCEAINLLPPFFRFHLGGDKGNVGWWIYWIHPWLVEPDGFCNELTLPGNYFLEDCSLCQGNLEYLLFFLIICLQ